MIEDKLAATEDKKVINNLHEKMAALGDLLDMDDQYSLTPSNDSEDSA